MASGQWLQLLADAPGVAALVLIILTYLKVKRIEAQVAVLYDELENGHDRPVRPQPKR